LLLLRDVPGKPVVWGALLALAAGACLPGCGGKDMDAGSSDLAFEKGWENFRFGDYERAGRFFNGSLAMATNGAQRVRALYSLGDWWNHKTPGRDEKRAGEFYAKVVAEDASGLWAPWAALAIARFKQTGAKAEELDSPPLAVLEEVYGKVMLDYPGHAVADEAFLFLQSARLISPEDGPVDRAMEELEEWVESRRDSLYAEYGHKLLANGYLLQKKPVKHINAQKTGMEIALTHKQYEDLQQYVDMPWTFLKIAISAMYDTGDFDLARSFLRQFLAGTPVEMRAFAAEQMLDMMDEYEAKVREELKEELGIMN
jgi:hypothetical protein